MMMLKNFIVFVFCLCRDRKVNPWNRAVNLDIDIFIDKKLMYDKLGMVNQWGKKKLFIKRF